MSTTRTTPGAPYSWTTAALMSGSLTPVSLDCDGSLTPVSPQWPRPRRWHVGPTCADPRPHHRGRRAVADAGGLGAVSMRNVGREVGVGGDVALPPPARQGGAARRARRLGVHPDQPARPDQPWRVAMRRGPRRRARRCPPPVGAGPHRVAARTRARPCSTTTTRCSAACGAPGSRSRLAAHAYSVLDAYVYGFVLTELNLPMEAGEGAKEFAEGLALAAEDYPHLVEMMTEQIAGRQLRLRRRVRLRPRPGPRRARAAAGPGHGRTVTDERGTG